jgi:putative Ig domain-containing protein
MYVRPGYLPYSTRTSDDRLLGARHDEVLWEAAFCRPQPHLRHVRMRPSFSYGRRKTRTHQGRVRNWGQRTTLICRVGVLMSLCALVACGAGERATPAAPVFSYNGSNPFPAAVGEAIALTPTTTGTAEHYSVSPPLPPGLTLNAQNGVISGTPTKASAPATFVVGAAGPGVRVTFPLVLSVTEPPSGLSYVSPVNATVGAALTSLRPRIAGTVEHYAVSPTLPPGVALDSANGILSGTPSEARGVAPYTITASSLAGNTRFVLLLTVMPAPSATPPDHHAGPGDHAERTDTSKRANRP